MSVNGESHRKKELTTISLLDLDYQHQPISMSSVKPNSRQPPKLRGSDCQPQTEQQPVSNIVDLPKSLFSNTVDTGQEVGGRITRSSSKKLVTAENISESEPNDNGDSQDQDKISLGELDTIFSLPPTPPSTGGKKSKISLLSTSKPEGHGDGTNLILVLENGQPRLVPLIPVQPDTSVSDQPMIEVMCDLPVQSNISCSPEFSTDLSESGTSPVPMKTHPIKVFLPSATAFIQNENQTTAQKDNDTKSDSLSCVTTKKLKTVTGHSVTTLSTPDDNTPPVRKLSVSGTAGISKIGRPKKSEVKMLQAEGETSSSELKCLVCKRVFPRVKSLEAHMRIHTGEKPYGCDFPYCNRSFNQSGQLRTHHRLHTGEKPFKCDGDGCDNRYAHANRSCPLHPKTVLKRHPVTVIQTNIDAFPNRDEVAKWFYRYGRDHQLEVDISNYSNPKLKAEVKAELLVPQTTDIDICYERLSPPSPRTTKPVERSARRGKGQRKPGKESEIQGALALIELARN